MPPRAKKVLKEIPLESDSEKEEEVQEELPRIASPPPVRRRKPASDDPKKDKKIEALRIANEARLRKKIERELLEKQQAHDAKERELEEKIVSLIGRHLPQKNEKPQRPPPVRKPRQNPKAVSKPRKRDQSLVEEKKENSPPPPRQQSNLPERESPPPQAPPAQYYYQQPNEFDMMYQKIFG